MMRFANAAGAIVAGRLACADAMPTARRGRGQARGGRQCLRSRPSRRAGGSAASRWSSSNPARTPLRHRDDELIVLPLSGAAHRRDRRRDSFTLEGRDERVRRRHRLRVRAARRPRGDRLGTRRPVRPALLQGRPPPRGALRRRRGRPGRAARRRPGQPPGQQLLLARGLRGRPPDRRRGAHARRQLVQLPAAQARRGHPGQGDRARGDLLLRGRRRRLRLPARLRLGPGREIDITKEVRTGDFIVHAARLPRPVDGRPRLRPLLPERDGRPGRARVALHRRPRPRLDPRQLGRAGARSAAADDEARSNA